MKKRMAALLFAGIMAASLAGCSSKPAETTAAATEAATEAAAETDKGRGDCSRREGS